jgi:tRNA(Ile)-lysidine synthase TilS/MesJ
MLHNFITYIREKALFGPEEKILLAVSGGMDSAVMLHLFARAKFNFAVAHCNFGLRGEESDADEAFVKKLAKKYKAPFLRSISGPKLLRNRKRFRYKWPPGPCATNGFINCSGRKGTRT